MFQPDGATEKQLSRNFVYVQAHPVALTSRGAQSNTSKFMASTMYPTNSKQGFIQRCKYRDRWGDNNNFHNSCTCGKCNRCSSLLKPRVSHDLNGVQKVATSTLRPRRVLKGPKVTATEESKSLNDKTHLFSNTKLRRLNHDRKEVFSVVKKSRAERTSQERETAGADVTLTASKSRNGEVKGLNFSPQELYE